MAAESFPSTTAHLQTETLNQLPTTLTLSCFSSRRRSHLDSASYRTLVRLYSLRLDETEEEEDRADDPNPSLNPDSNEKKGPFFIDAHHELPDPKSEIAEKSQLGEEFSNSKLQSYLDDDEEEELVVGDDCIDMGLLEDIMTDCAKLVGDQQDEDAGLGQIGLNPILMFLDDGLEANNQEKDTTFEKFETVENLAENTELDKESREEAWQDEMPSNSRELNEETEKSMPFKKLTVPGIEEGTLQDVCAHFDLSSEGFGAGKLVDSPVGSEEMEEGEIPNDFENSSEHVYSIHEDAEVEDKNSEEESVHEDFDKNGDPSFSMCTSSIKVSNEYASSSLICEGNQSFKAFDNGWYVESQTKKNPTALENLAAKEVEKPCDAEGLVVQVRKKRGPLTEKQKAKKKIAKKRQRAKKEREQGVKRLKLQPITKPKKIEYCNRYLNGRCQQGDKCKFSHDITPLKKSQACKYFASDSCLKGSDCEFDHQLSNHPCHKYMSEGTCSRGDSCKFSHKFQTSILSKADSHLSLGRSDLANQLHTNSTSPNIIDQPKTTTSCLHSVMHKPLVGNLADDSRKPAQNIPKGICFISFGSGPLDKVDKEKNNGLKCIPVKQSRKDKLSSELLNCGASSSHVSKESNGTSFVKEPARVTSRSLQTEVSEASKILEEFLFCGGT